MAIKTATRVKTWWAESAAGVPEMAVPAPGPKSRALHARGGRYLRGLSGQVKLFPVCFESGHGITLTDVDGNRYLDFSSGIYVTSLGHCHPKVSEAVAHWAKTLMNCHDFFTPVKAALLELNSKPFPLSMELQGQAYDAFQALRLRPPPSLQPLPRPA